MGCDAVLHRDCQEDIAGDGGERDLAERVTRSVDGLCRRGESSTITASVSYVVIRLRCDAGDASGNACFHWGLAMAGLSAAIPKGYVPGVPIVDLKASPYIWAILDSACNSSVFSTGWLKNKMAHRRYWLSMDTPEAETHEEVRVALNNVGLRANVMWYGATV